MTIRNHHIYSANGEIIATTQENYDSSDSPYSNLSVSKVLKKKPKTIADHYSQVDNLKNIQPSLQSFVC